MPAAGGLVSMLMPLAAQSNVTWFCCVSEPPDARHAQRGLFTTAADQADPSLHVVPIPLPAEMYHAYYGQISNEVLWMLQHRVIGPSGFGQLDHDRHDAWEQGYLAANARMAEVIRESCFNVRAFLIQDYHLYPLPALLRPSFPDTPIAHFTHIPFPDPSLMRLLPGAWREAILNGMLGADVVGLQTERDVHAFMKCCESFVNVTVDRASGVVVGVDGRRVIVRAYPASVELEELARCMASPAVARARVRVVPRMGEMRVIRVDRLDPSKNQLIGFRAFGRLLELRSDLRSRVRFSAFLVPSRTDLSIYRAYRDEIYACIAEINDRYPRPDGTPVIDVFYTNNREQALAAMEECDVLLVNSLQDGMNLVAKEWALISRRPGVLVLSETVGVADDAKGAALLVSPLDVDGTAQALAQALDMPELERRGRLDTMRRRVQSWTADDWLSAQLRDLGVAASLGPAT
ncbi:MAG: Trehalose-6-phosphate synthase [Chloroflexi bacterium]|nr:Trehalose-6-phosphate synthase [Chloroflexota bacterium]